MIFGVACLGRPPLPFIYIMVLGATNPVHFSISSHCSGQMEVGNISYNSAVWIRL